MKTIQINRGFPNLNTTPRLRKILNQWDNYAVANLIRKESAPGRYPAFLFLGRTETELLRSHLAGVFGAAAVTTLHDSYYMGLRVVTVDAGSHLSVGGRKVTSSAYLPVMLDAS